MNTSSPPSKRVRTSNALALAFLVGVGALGASPDGVDAATVVLDEDWTNCTSTFGQYPSDAADGKIAIKAWSEGSGTLTCPDWTPSGQAWLSEITGNTSGITPPAIGSRAMYLNEGDGGATLGKISRTLTGLTPGGFYEIIVLAWRDAGSGPTRLGLEINSGVVTEYFMNFADGNALPQTVRLRFPVAAETATITLTGGYQSGVYASPIVGSVRIESRLGEFPTVVFLPGEGSGEMEPQSGSAPAGLRPNAFVFDGCTFVEWHDDKGTAYADEAEYDFSDDLVLTAQWSCPDDEPHWPVDLSFHFQPHVLPNTR